MSKGHSKPVLNVFAKMWNRGPVKTRLAADIGESSAREWYRRVSELVWQQLESPHFERWLWMVDEDSCKDGASWLKGADKVLPQCNGSLGTRIFHALESASKSGPPWCAIVGTDAPAVCAEMILEAGQLLETGKELALTPALDGGYAMLALREPHQELFEGVEWSTPQVLEQTLSKAQALNLNFSLLPPVQDMDTKEDLAALSGYFQKAGSGS